MMCAHSNYAKRELPKKVEKQGDFLAALYNIAPTNILEFENIFYGGEGDEGRTEQDFVIL